MLTSEGVTPVFHKLLNNVVYLILWRIMRNARSASRGTSDAAVVQLRALWKRYEYHCLQTHSCPCTLLKQDILLNIEKQQPLKKVL